MGFFHIHDGNGTHLEKRSWSSTGVKDVLYSGSLVFIGEPASVTTAQTYTTS